MTNKKSTKKALLMSALSLLLCCSMLIGTTFAWFTDEVNSGTNIIAAGNLDVALYHTDDKVSNEEVTSSTMLFDDVSPKLWEPGAVAYEILTVKNEGSLALKYQLSVIFDNATKTPAGKTLADALQVAVVDEAELTSRENAIAAGEGKWQKLASFDLTGTLEAEASETYGIVIYWQPTSNDNDFNMNNGIDTVLSIDLGVKLSATQLMHENDSYGPDYDEDALDCDVLATPETINEILATVEPGTVIGLSAGKYGTIKLTQSNLTLVSNSAVVGQLDLNEQDSITIDGLTFDAATAQVAYNAGGKDSGYVTNLTDGKFNNGGSVGVVIKNCAFIGTAVDSTKYIPVYFGDTGRSNRSDDITIENCEFQTNALQYIALNGVTNNSNTTPGKIVIKNNIFGGNGFGTSHNTINATGQTCDWAITGNQFNNWNIEKTAIGSSTNGGRVMTWNVIGNEFNNNDGAIIMALKSSYTDANTVVNFADNTVLGGNGTIVTTSVDAENKATYAGHKIQLDTGVVYAATTQELIDAIKNAPVGETTSIVLADGIYADNIDITVAALGQSGGDVVIKAMEGAKPVITGTVTLGYREQTVGATMYNANVTFEGITFNHVDATLFSIEIGDVKSLNLVNCTIIGSGETGIHAARGNGTGPSKITGCTFINAALQGYGNYCTDMLIEKCTFNNSCINIQAGNGVTVQGCIFNNTLTDANNNESFYVIRSNSTPITVTGCAINIDSTVTGIGVAHATKGWGVFVNRGTTTWTVNDVQITLTDAAQTQTALEIAKCTSTGAINMTDVTVNTVNDVPVP